MSNPTAQSTQPAQAVHRQTLVAVLTQMLDTPIVRADYVSTQLQGGTLGDVRLLTGLAETSGGEKRPYKVVLKKQNAWERPGDANSWRREYDLYTSDFGAAFEASFRWPRCYHAERADGAIQLWMEYIDGVSGSGLTLTMLEQAAAEIGRFQGRLYRRPEALADITCLGDPGYIQRDYSQWTPETVEYRYLRSDECELPAHLREMLINTQRLQDAVFAGMRKLPVVLCHRDFWIENIMHTDGKTVLIDWDCAGWGYLGEDIASLIADETDPERLDEYCDRLIPAYLRGLSEYMDISAIRHFFIREMILIKFGYRLLQVCMFSDSAEAKRQSVIALQKIYDMEASI